MSYVKNVGFVDQIIRALIILDIVAAYTMEFVAGFSAFVLIPLALVLMVSCLTGFCPMYAFLGFSSRQEYEDRHR